MKKRDIKDAVSWQVGWENENIPAFGLEFFDDEDEALEYGESLQWELRHSADEIETGIVLTKLKNDEPVMTWELVDGDWK